jgi:hypothetical protein
MALNPQMYVVLISIARTHLMIACSTNLLIILAFMQISKKVPFDDPNVLNAVRALYILSNVAIAGIYLYVQAQIKKKNGAYILCGPCRPVRGLHISLTAYPQT